MDLGLVKRKINEGKYKTIHEAAEDVRLIWKNCKTYNADGSDFYNLAQVSEREIITYIFMIDLLLFIGYGVSHSLHMCANRLISPSYYRVDHGKQVRRKV
jgi:hypothetical protein